MVKILYLLAGIALKQTVDEFKTMINEYIEYLKKCRDEIQTLRGAPVAMKGSVEAHQAIARHEHKSRVEPAVKQLTRKIFYVRIVPVTIYTILTVGLLTWIWVLEKAEETKPSGYTAPAILPQSTDPVQKLTSK